MTPTDRTSEPAEPPEARASFLNMVLDAVPIGVFVVDVDGTPIYANRAAARLLGRGPDPNSDANTLARDYQAFETGTHRPYPQQRMPILRALNGEETSVSDMEIEQQHGRIPLRVWGKPIRDEQDNIVHAVAIFLDITEEQRAQQDSRHLQGQLLESDEALRETREQLTRHERLALIGRLSGSVSHELRQPLGVIINSVHAIRGRAPEGDERFGRQLDRIERQAWQAERIVSDLLDFSRRRDPERAAISLAQVVSDTLSSRPPGPGIQIHLEIPDEVRIFVDATQISHALANLLRNASEAMEHQGRIVLRAEQAGDMVHLVIEDEGPGIADSVLKRLFEPLVTTKASGIGLGLVVATTFVERNGGRLRGSNRDEGGAVFVLELPSAPR